MAEADLGMFSRTNSDPYKREHPQARKYRTAA